MLSKFLATALVATLIVAGLYYFVTEKKVANLEVEVDNQRKMNAAFEVRDKEQARTIEKLQSDFKKTAEALQAQSARNAEIQAEMNRYLDIFKRHDLTKLAAAKPGLIEKKVNKGTKNVFDSIEKDSDISSSITGSTK
jgi:Tfp pilus assembly protein PilO